MSITSDQLFRQLQKQLMPLYTITGDELLLAMEAADAIRNHARQHDYTERDIFTVDHRFDWSNLQRWKSQSSLFGERRILDLRIPTGKPGKEGSNAIEALCQNQSADTITLIMLPKIDKQTQASKWFKTLEQSSVMVTADPIEYSRLANWIQQRLDIQGQQIAPDTLQFLVNKVEGNLLAAQQEIKKLALLYPSGILSFEQVKDAVLDVARYDVFSLPEAMLTADTVHYTRILEGLQGEGTPPPLILSTLTEPIRTLLLIHQALDAGKPLAQALKDSQVWNQQQKIMTVAVKRLPSRLLLQALLHAASIDRIIKGIAQGDIWNELLQLGLRLTTRQSFMH
ncbi:DNA polymerase III subunit delta [Nitrosomonas sp. Is37]|uniref:DNA polymerase III subunit delta n=1 Tax=Nitrosomonas sp. Is37 TaxID=3080535 RepID=UPI00294B82F5|nr:DNA polymerase III subunit delta [Nitrosomonas sp. Is37]MDV6343358.1 DNA polymerase III subunit delta [Nitrosomonas sp. Is37]